MKGLFALLILSVFASAAPAFAQMTREISREVLFTKAFLNLKTIVEAAASAEELETLPAVQRRLYEELLRVVSAKTFTIRFDRDPRRFRLAAHEAPRTAVTTANPLDDVWINQWIIDSKKTDLGFLDAVQLLIHESGHKIPGRDLAAMDALGSWLRTKLETRSHETKTASGLRLWSMAAGDRFFLFQDDGAKIEDLGPSVEKTLTSERNLNRADTGAPLASREELRVTDAQWIGNGSRERWQLRLEWLQQTADFSRWGGPLKDYATTRRTETLSLSRRKGGATFTVEKLERAAADAGLLRSLRLVPGTGAVRRFEAKMVLKEGGEIPRLVLETGDARISVAGRATELDTYVYEWTPPESAAVEAVEARSLEFANGNKLWAPEGVRIEFPYVTKTPIELRGVSLAAESGPARLGWGRFVEPGQHRLLLKFKSDSEITEIHLRQRSEIDLFEDPAKSAAPADNRVRPVNIFDIGAPNPSDRISLPLPDAKPLARWSRVETRRFDVSQFRQTRLGEFVVVEIPFTEAIRNEVLDGDLGVVTRRTGSGFFNWTMNTPTARSQSRFGLDTGDREILQIDAVNARLASTQVRPRMALRWSVPVDHSWERRNAADTQRTQWRQSGLAADQLVADPLARNQAPRLRPACSRVFSN